MTAFTLPSIVCVTFRTCAVAIRASSCVNLSSLLLRQLIEPLQRILDVGPSDKFLEIFFWEYLGQW